MIRIFAQMHLGDDKMKETAESTDKLIEDMLSGDSMKIWSASCGICSLSQNEKRIRELIPYEKRFIEAIQGIELGGAIAPNKRFLKKIFEILSYYKKEEGCPCCLLGEDSNPRNLIEDSYFELIDTIYFKDSNYVDYYVMYCKNCKKEYKVEEREYHYTWWDWKVIEK